MPEWTSFLSAMTLVLVRVSGMAAFAPFFSSTALTLRTKAVFVGVVAYLLAPLVATLPRAQVSLGFSALLGELAVGLVYGLTLALLNEMLLFAGQIAGVQFSFSMVNLLDPTSSALAAGELVGVTRLPVGEAEVFQHRHSGQTGLPCADAVELEWKRDVLKGGETRQEVELLEDVADRASSKPCVAVARHLLQRVAVDQHLTARRLLEAAGDREQRRLP